MAPTAATSPPPSLALLFIAAAVGITEAVNVLGVEAVGAPGLDVADASKDECVGGAGVVVDGAGTDELDERGDERAGIVLEK